MKTILTAVCAALISSALTLSFSTAANTRAAEQGGDWHLAYSHDKDGQPLDGSKQALVDSILAGKPVRIYWAGRTVQHVMDAGILTVLEGEVFAQIQPITAQRPSTNPAKVELVEGEWQTIFATNGDRPLKWFVQD